MQRSAIKMNKQHNNYYQENDLFRSLINQNENRNIKQDERRMFNEIIPKLKQFIAPEKLIFSQQTNLLSVD